MSVSSAVLGYIASKQPQGGLASDKEREKSLSYQEKYRQTKKEEEGLLRSIEDKLREEYARLVCGSTVDYKQLNFARVYLHYKFGHGRPMYIDITGQYIPALSAKHDFNDQVGWKISKNTLELSHLSTVGITLGRVDFEYLGNNKVKIIKSDRYDFDLDRSGISQRNILTFIGGIVHDIPWPSAHPMVRLLTSGGDRYDIYFKGEATINP